MKRKGVVVEIAPKNKVIIMTSEGEFIRIPLKKHVHVGQEIRYTPRKTRFNVLQAGLVATLFLALIGTWPVLTGRLVPGGAAAYVMTVDVNPSFELQISAENRVLAVEGLNRDGRQVAAKLAVVGDDLRSALRKLAVRLQKDGYLGSGQKQILVTMAGLNYNAASQRDIKRARELKKGDSGTYRELQKMAEEVFGTIQLAELRMWEVPSPLLTEAKLAGITPSRYLAIHLPALFAIPQRTAVRLTVNDPAADEKMPSARVQRTAAASSSPPALTPARWTGQSVTSFPIVAELKGDFRVKQ